MVNWAGDTQPSVRSCVSEQTVRSVPARQRTTRSTTAATHAEGVADALSAVRVYRENTTIVDREEKVLLAQLEGNEALPSSRSAKSHLGERSSWGSSTNGRYSRLGDMEAGAIAEVDEALCEGCVPTDHSWVWPSMARLRGVLLNELQVVLLVMPLVAIVNADVNADVNALSHPSRGAAGADSVTAASVDVRGARLRVTFSKIIPIFLMARAVSLAFEAVARTVLLFRGQFTSTSLACKASYGWPSTAILFCIFLSSVPIWFLYGASQEQEPTELAEETTPGEVECAFGCPFGGLMQWLWKPTRHAKGIHVWAGIGKLPRFWPLIAWLFFAAVSRILLEVLVQSYVNSLTENRFATRALETHQAQQVLRKIVSAARDAEHAKRQANKAAAAARLQGFWRSKSVRKIPGIPGAAGAPQASQEVLPGKGAVTDNRWDGFMYQLQALKGAMVFGAGFEDAANVEQTRRRARRVFVSLCQHPHLLVDGADADHEPCISRSRLLQWANLMPAGQGDPGSAGLSAGEAQLFQPSDELLNEAIFVSGVERLYKDSRLLTASVASSSRINMLLYASTW